MDASQNQRNRSITPAFPSVTCKDAYPVICTARTIKDTDEIPHIREAIALKRDGIHALMKAGMDEYQLEAVFNKVLADDGISEPAFANIVSAGHNNFYIHYEKPMGLLKGGDLILTDVGIYIEDKNIGFRNEDNVAFTETGYEHLSADIAREIDYVEAMMN